jgi:hypothetical protein
MELVNKLHEDFSTSYVSSIFLPVVFFGQAEIFILLVFCRPAAAALLV